MRDSSPHTGVEDSENPELLLAEWACRPPYLGFQFHTHPAPQD